MQTAAGLLRWIANHMNDHRKLESFALVHRHHLHAVNGIRDYNAFFDALSFPEVEQTRDALVGVFLVGKSELQQGLGMGREAL